MGSFTKYVSKIYRKTYIFYLLLRTRLCAYQGVGNVSFSKNFADVLNELSLDPCFIWLFYKWDKVFKNGPSKICGRQPVKNLFSPFLNTSSQMFDRLNQSSIDLSALRKTFADTEFFLGRIFPYSGWIWRFTVNLHIQPEYGEIRTRESSVFGYFPSIARFRKILKSTFWRSLCNIDPLSC